MKTNVQDMERGGQEAGASGTTIGQYHDVDAGPLGGTMQCAAITFNAVDGTICGFADPAALGMILTFHSGDEAVVRQLRAGIELRS
jgi:hypothetical protein